MRKKGLAAVKSRNAYFYLLPGTLLMIFFVVVPVLMSLYISFFRIPSLGAEWEFVGWANYRYMFEKQNWLGALWKTVLYGAWGILTGLVFGLLLAFLVAKHRLLNVWRYVFYLPSVVSAITISRLWNYVLSPTETGLLNILAMNWFGVSTPINWLGDENLVPFVVMALGLYGAGGGINLVLFTTAINNIPYEQREAASIEGASNWTIATKIELPQIRPIISSIVILGLIGAFKNFESLYALAPDSGAIDTIAVMLYKVSIGIGSEDGYGVPAAMGMVLTVFIVGAMSLYILWPQKKEEVAA